MGLFDLHGVILLPAIETKRLMSIATQCRYENEKENKNHE